MRHPSAIYLKTGVKKDGTIVSKYAKYILNMGAYVDCGDLVVQWVGLNFTATYRSANMKFEGYSVYTNNPVGAGMRGFGNPQQIFAVESQMDMIAEKLGIDRFELRLKNARESGDKLPCDWQLKSCGLKQCIESVSEADNLEFSKTKTKSNDPKRMKVGIGIACGTHGLGWKAGFCSRVGISDTDPSTCIIKIDGDGAIRIFTGELDYGQGCATGIAQVVAEELCANFEDIEVIFGETTLVPYGKGPYGSRSLWMGGMSAKLAAIDAKKQLLKIASEIWEANIRELKLDKGFVAVKGTPQKSISIAD